MRLPLAIAVVLAVLAAPSSSALVWPPEKLAASWQHSTTADQADVWELLISVDLQNGEVLSLDTPSFQIRNPQAHPILVELVQGDANGSTLGYENAGSFAAGNQGSVGFQLAPIALAQANLPSGAQLSGWSTSCSMSASVVPTGLNEALGVPAGQAERFTISSSSPSIDQPSPLVGYTTGAKPDALVDFSASVAVIDRMFLPTAFSTESFVVNYQARATFVVRVTQP